MLKHTLRSFYVAIVALCLSTAFFASAQQPTKDSTNSAKNSTFIKDTTIRGVSYPMYRGAKGGKYIIRTSKVTGNTYKQYFKQ